MTLTLSLTSEVEQYLLQKSKEAGVSAEDYAASIIKQHVSHFEKKSELADLLDSWIDEGDVEEQTETGEYLIRSLDDDRTSHRKLFPPELKGVTW